MYGKKSINSDQDDPLQGKRIILIRMHLRAIDQAVKYEIEREKSKARNDD